MESNFSFQFELKATILGTLIWIPLWFILGPAFLGFFVFYTIVHKLAAKRHPDLIPLSTADNFLVPTPISYTYTAQVWKVRGEIDVPSFRQHFYKCFLSNGEDRKKYVNLYCYFIQYFGYVFKKKVKTIDLEYHIHEHKLEEDETVEGFVGRWMMTHDKDEKSGEERPIWMMKIIKEEDKKGIVTHVVFKLHHGICDGYTMVHLVGKLSGEHAPYMFREPTPPFLKKVKCLVQFPYLTASLWMKMAKSAKKPLVSYVNENKEDWLISFCTLDLKSVKQIRRVTGTNFVSVLMSIQAGALKRLLRNFNPGKKLEMEDSYLGHSMGWPHHPVMTKGGGMGNHLTLNIVKASMKIDDPLERLLDLDRNFRETKFKGYPIMIYYLALNINKYQPVPVNKMIIDSEWSILGVEHASSALLCSGKPHYLMGKPVEHLYLPVVTPSVFKKIKLMTVPVSHSGILDISINASTALVRNQEMLDRLTKIYFLEEFEDLKKRCQNLVE